MHRPTRSMGSVAVFAAASALAVAACGGAAGPGGTTTSSAAASAVALSKCMRSHGVSNFPDPTFSGTGVRIGDKELNPQTPAFQRAVRRCRGTKPLRVVAGG